MAGRQRARSPEDKQERRAHILATALELWGERTFTSFTMAEVAARSGLAKGTLYLYFATKEELLLALLESQLAGWFDDLDAGLAEGGPWDGERLAELICDAVDRQPALARLLPIAASILEHNLPLATARAYKEGLLARSARSAARIEERLPHLARGDAVWLLQQVYALIVGLGQMADPAPLVAQILAAEPMAPLRVEFGPALRRAVATLLRGLAAGA
ncbi:MAG TPA: TetR family transcriptional regulator [Chloroflexaceae bacterium]|nr:TetR family transcriptional regulator [Chloroflexaceae bacterium]